jgi:branched-chain amino acid transport system ATP-binding protein
LRSNTLLSVDSINVAYGSIRALREVSLHVNEGEIVAIIGANGAGKTTLMMSISGIAPVSSGKITFAGNEIQRYKAHKIAGMKLCQVPEGRRIFARLSVEENLKMGAFSIHSRNKTLDLIEQAYSIFPVLRDRRQQLGGTLSGGEQQMLAIARALMSEPRMLLLDEPSLGIAPIMVERIFDVIRQLNTNGLTVLLVEQNAHLALATSRRAYVLETGAICMHDDSDSLLGNPLIQEAYLGRI